MSRSRWDSSPTILDTCEIHIPSNTNQVLSKPQPELINETTSTLTKNDLQVIKDKSVTENQGADGTWTTSRWSEDDLSTIDLPKTSSLPPKPSTNTFSEMKITVVPLSTATTAFSSAVSMELSDSDASSPPRSANTSVIARLRAAEQENKESADLLTEKKKEDECKVKESLANEKLAPTLPPTSIGVQLRKSLETHITATESNTTKKNGCEPSPSNCASPRSDHVSFFFFSIARVASVVSFTCLLLMRPLGFAESLDTLQHLPMHDAYEGEMRHLFMFTFRAMR